jgi:hypothetical protein
MATRSTSTTSPATEHTSLAAALAALQGNMPTVHKDKNATVQTKTGGSYRYTYADLASVTSTAYPLLSAHGLSFTTQPRRTETGAYELVGTLMHTSGEHLEGSLPLYGAQAQDLGSSITYARRYLLGCMTGLVTDDDEDGNLAQQADRAQQERPQAPPSTSPAPAPDPWVDARDKAFRRYCAMNPEAQQPDAFMAAVTRDLGKPWTDLKVEDFEGWGK